LGEPNKIANFSLRKGGWGLLKITPAQKIKVMVAALWVCLLIIQALWGERNLEPTGLATDSGGNIYLSLVDAYRAEACLQKINSSGKRLWSQNYQGERVSGAELQNMVLASAGAIYQIINEYGKNSSYVTVLKYEPNGRRGWVKELYNQSFYKNFSLAGNDLVILGMDRNFASLKLNCLKPDGNEVEPVLIFNPFERKRTWFQKINDGVFLAAEDSHRLKIMKIKPDGQKMASFTVAAGRLLGLDQTEAIYLAAEDGSQAAKYSANGGLIWNNRLKRQWDRKMKEDLRPDYLEIDQNQNAYLAGKAQLFASKPKLYQIADDRNEVRYFARRKYWRSYSGDRIFIAKFNPSGVLAWINQLVTNQRYPKMGGLAVDRDENVYVAGNFTFLDAQRNWYLAKYNRQGKLAWVKRKYQLPGSLFYIGLAGAFLLISLLKKERIWKSELAICLGLMLLFWGKGFGLM
jgi:hypothetical protein